MKFTTAFFITACFFLLVIVYNGRANTKESNLTPLAVVEQTTIEFPPVIAGAEAKQRFSILNKGNAPLNIINVYSG